MARRNTADKRQRPGLLRRFWIFLITLALTLGALALVANYDRLNIDAIRRYFTYRFLQNRDDGDGVFLYDQGSRTFAPLGDGLAVCTPVSLIACRADGTAYLTQPVSLSQPVLACGSNAVLAYEAGGRTLFLLSGSPEPLTLSLDSGEILSARINASNWTAMVARDGGHKASVTVYDNALNPVLQINLSSRFVTDAAVAPDNRSVALVSIGLDASGSFESRVDLYRLDRTTDQTEPDVSCPVGNNVCLALRWDSSGIWFLGESALALVGADGSLKASYSYAGRYLKSFTLDGNGCAVLLLGRYRAGSAADLVVVDRAGTGSALPLSEQVLSLSAAGRYIAVLSPTRLTIYNQGLEVYHCLESTQGAQNAIVRGDGSVILAGATSARLYVPD